MDIDKDEPLFSLNETDKVILNQEKFWFQRTTCVSDKMRRECTAELEEAKKNNYRFKKS
jgi:hypothetical protein